ncbi:hypothetical protein [Rhizobium leguminosarum]|uniref:hypothetical protein n=1 Tax=Rhizobium leguminosarum TaxID=384 RepID=UPI0021B0B51F|nr:hypothetical protein [Rhizobium leguminosarum]
MRRIIQRIAAKFDRVLFCYEAGSPQMSKKTWYAHPEHNAAEAEAYLFYRSLKPWRQM